MKTRAKMPHKRLREGTSLWADSPRITIHTRKNLNAVICDVAIVGAGITGAMTALLLAQDGHDVLVLDRREPITGSTMASTAMISFEIDTPLTQLAKKVGPAKAKRAYKRSYLSVRRLRKMVETHDIACGWKNQNSLYLAGTSMGARGLAAEVKARKRIGIPSTFVSQDQLLSKYGFKRTGAIESKGNAIANPAQLTAGLLREAVKLGAKVYRPHDVVDVIPGDGHVILCTTGCECVLAKRVVFATGYETLAQIPKDRFEINSTWALATKPVKNAHWPPSCLVWEASDPYIYMRAGPDGRVIAGGEDSTFTSPERREKMTRTKTRAVLKKISKLLPDADLKIDYAWSGSFATSPTGLPFIAPLKDLPYCFAVLGCGGNGITYAMVAAEMARAWVRGRKDKDADLFA